MPLFGYIRNELQAIFLTNIWKTKIEYLQIAVDGGIAEVVVGRGNDVRLHITIFVLGPELELGRVKNDLEVKVLAEVDVDQLLLGDSLEDGYGEIYL